jgi:hypothetical protein
MGHMGRSAQQKKMVSTIKARRQEEKHRVILNETKNLSLCPGVFVVRKSFMQRYEHGV